MERHGDQGKKWTMKILITSRTHLDSDGEKSPNGEES